MNTSGTTRTLKQTHIYFIQPEGGGLIKVGRALEPEKRLRELQIGSPVKLVLCRAEPAPGWWETRLHQVFAPWRQHGEWFKAHPALANIGDCIPDQTLEAEPIDLTAVVASESLWRSIQWANHDPADYEEPEPELEYEPDDPEGWRDTRSATITFPYWIDDRESISLTSPTRLRAA